MNTTAAVLDTPVARPRPTLPALARADAIRFARHPLFLLGALAMVVLAVTDLVRGERPNPDPFAFTLMTAFTLGVWGFVVAHRLTTSMRRSLDLVDTAPVGHQRRTMSLCLACLVPALFATLVLVFILVEYAVWTPVGIPATAHVAWFRDEPDLDVLTAVIALGPVAALGGPLLGVAVATWAPFRGSALVGVVALVFVTALPSSSPSPWRALSAWPVLYDELVDNGKITHSALVPGVNEPWVLGYLLCLCGLAVVAALLRDPANRRALLWTGGVLSVLAAACFTLAVS